MSGQSAGLTVKEACAAQMRIQAGTHDKDNGGHSGKTKSVKATKKPHTEAKYEPSHMEGAGD